VTLSALRTGVLSALRADALETSPDASRVFGVERNQRKPNQTTTRK
jgi:hypothetical protein